MKILSAMSAAFSIALLISNAGAIALGGTPTGVFERQTSACPAHNEVAATFFCSGTTGTTACGQKYDPNTPGVAISTALVANSDDLAPYCGMNVILSNVDKGVMASAPIIDLCATCSKHGEGPYMVDLTKETFSELNEGEPDCDAGGELTVSWFLDLDTSKGVGCI